MNPVTNSSFTNVLSLPHENTANEINNSETSSNSDHMEDVMEGPSPVNDVEPKDLQEISINEEASKLNMLVQHGTPEEIELFFNGKSKEQVQAIFSDIQQNSERGNTVLHTASLRRSEINKTLQIIEELINAGAPINAVNADRQTPLDLVMDYQLDLSPEHNEYAERTIRVKIVRKLVLNGGKNELPIDIPKLLEFFSWIVQYGSLEEAELLLNLSKSSPQAFSSLSDFLGKTDPFIIKKKAICLYWVVRHKSPNNVYNLILVNKNYLEEIFNVIQQNNEEKNTILHIASFRSGDSTETIEIIDLLIKAGASINAVNAKGQSPLAQIIDDQRTEDEKICYTYDSDDSDDSDSEIDFKNIDDRDGIEIALYFLENHTNIVIQALTNKKELGQCLYWALAESKENSDTRVEIAQLLIDKEADVNIKDLDGGLLIAKLLKERGYEALWLLKQDDIDLLKLTPEQRKELAFEICFFWDYSLGDSSAIKKALQKLVDSGLTLNELNENNQSLLIRSAQLNNEDVVTSILSFPNIDLLITDKHGFTALDYAIANGNNELYSRLKAAVIEFSGEKATEVVFNKILESDNVNYLDLYEDLLIHYKDHFVALLTKKNEETATTVSQELKQRLEFFNQTLNASGIQEVKKLIEEQRKIFIEVVFNKILKSNDVNYLDLYEGLLIRYKDYFVALLTKKNEETATMLSQGLKQRLEFFNQTLNANDIQEVKKLIEEQRAIFNREHNRQQLLRQMRERISNGAIRLHPNLQQLIIQRLTPRQQQAFRELSPQIQQRIQGLTPQLLQQTFRLLPLQMRQRIIQRMLQRRQLFNVGPKLNQRLK